MVAAVVEVPVGVAVDLTAVPRGDHIQDPRGVPEAATVSAGRLHPDRVRTDLLLTDLLLTVRVLTDRRLLTNRAGMVQVRRRPHPIAPSRNRKEPRLHPRSEPSSHSCDTP